MTSNPGVAIQERIRRVLHGDWDPFGVNDVPECADEYDSYVGPIYRLLTSDATPEAIVAELRHLTLVNMGVTPVPDANLLEVARKLKALNVRLGDAAT